MLTVTHAIKNIDDKKKELEGDAILEKMAWGHLPERRTFELRQRSFREEQVRTRELT